MIKMLQKLQSFRMSDKIVIILFILIQLPMTVLLLDFSRKPYPVHENIISKPDLPPNRPKGEVDTLKIGKRMTRSNLEWKKYFYANKSYPNRMKRYDESLKNPEMIYELPVIWNTSNVILDFFFWIEIPYFSTLEKSQYHICECEFYSGKILKGKRCYSTSKTPSSIPRYSDSGNLYIYFIIQLIPFLLYLLFFGVKQKE